LTIDDTASSRRRSVESPSPSAGIISGDHPKHRDPTLRRPVAPAQRDRS
jgi:hypothetical protein